MDKHELARDELANTNKEGSAMTAAAAARGMEAVKEGWVLIPKS